MAKRTGPTFIQRSRSVRPEEKAAFHQVSGAGRAKVKRPFLGLTKDDEDAILERVAAGLDRILKGQV